MEEPETGESDADTDRVGEAEPVEAALAHLLFEELCQHESLQPRVNQDCETEGGDPRAGIKRAEVKPFIEKDAGKKLPGESGDWNEDDAEQRRSRVHRN